MPPNRLLSPRSTQPYARANRHFTANFSPRAPCLSFPFRTNRLHQLFVQIAVLRFRKMKWRMDRLAAEAEAYRFKRDTAFLTHVLRAWRADARGRGGVRKKIVTVVRRRNKRVSSKHG